MREKSVTKNYKGKKQKINKNNNRRKKERGK